MRAGSGSYHYVVVNDLSMLERHNFNGLVPCHSELSFLAGRASTNELGKGPGLVRTNSLSTYPMT